MSFDPSRIQQILDVASTDARADLFEHEVYQVLACVGCAVPRFAFVPVGQIPRPSVLVALQTPSVVVKVVSPEIAHKTDVGGVAKVPADEVPATIARMLQEIPARYVAWRRGHGSPPHADDDALARTVRDSIRGFLVVECIRMQGEGLGAEVLLGLRHHREFGPVLTFGVGGVDTELLGHACRKGLSVVSASAVMLNDEQLLRLGRSTLAYRRLAGMTRGGRMLVTDEQQRRVLEAFRNIALHFGSDGPGAQKWTITELEVNPFAVSEGRLVALDGLLKFRPSRELDPARPPRSIDALLHPNSIAVAGVSAKTTNMGRIILRNVLQVGFDASRAYVVRPGIAELDGVRCVPSIEALPERVDVFVLAVAAEQVPEMIEQLVEHDKAVGVVLIAGGMGEKEGGQTLEQRVKQAVKRARSEGKGLVINGGNSLGIVSRPGNYHTLFIPQSKLPLRTDGRSNVAFLSQSGAYMISRMSKLAWLSPRYAVSTGNQIDLSIADYLAFLGGDDALQTFAVYVEGFNDADGLAFAQAVRETTKRGKDVVFYKAGRTAEGKSATSGHTASLAGEYDVCEAIVREAGAHVASTFSDYMNLVKLSSLLGHKRWGGRRIAAMSNAGYEAVGIADSVRGEGWELRLASLGASTRARLAKALADNKLDTLVDVRNPLDVTPMASDQAHEDVVQAFMDDPDVDIVLCASVPLTPAMATLAAGVPESQSIRAPGSLPNRLGRVVKVAHKPLVGCIDSGALFDPLARALEAQGVPAFRSADEAVRTLGLYVEGRARRGA
ncbi:MAG: acetate--CoA ligase family protein [Polyangiaceae bacterium]|nr:acetate--CoA ligase family protein [Polyangiaceae bacterium]